MSADILETTVMTAVADARLLGSEHGYRMGLIAAARMLYERCDGGPHDVALLDAGRMLIARSEQPVPDLTKVPA